MLTKLVVVINKTMTVAVRVIMIMIIGMIIWAGPCPYSVDYISPTCWIRLVAI